MSKQKLLQRLVASLATNHGVQPNRTEIWQRLKSLTSREVDVLCYVLGGQLNKELAAELGIGEKTIKVHRNAYHGKAWSAIKWSITRNGVACGIDLKNETRMTNPVGQLLTALLASGMLLT
jgi:hypothetical protein